MRHSPIIGRPIMIICWLAWNQPKCGFCEKCLRIPKSLDRSWKQRQPSPLSRNRYCLLKTTRTRKAEFWGHVTRRSKLENLAVTGKFDGKKGPTRPRTSYVTNRKKWLDHTANKNTVIQASATRERDGATWSPAGPGTATDDERSID